MEEPKPLSDAARVPGLTPNSIHFVRTLQQITLSYSQMADQKASMLMAGTFVVFTIAVGQARGGAVPIALSVLALFAFASALCAILAVLPSFAKPSSGRPNAIFFGVFAHQDEDEWIEQVMAELSDDPTFYRTMLRDIHQNGLVLEAKKYRWLGRGYRIFLVGLCLTAAVFALEFAGMFDRLA
jgi:hypothetical protein